MTKKESTYQTITTKLRKLEEATLELEKFQKMSKQAFFKDAIIKHACLYDFVMAIEAICDIGNHVLAKYYAGGEPQYKDIIIKLGEYGVISEKLSKEAEDMTDFRNFLIHVYAKVDDNEVYKNLQNGPQQFRKFAKYFVKFLEKTK